MLKQLPSPDSPLDFCVKFYTPDPGLLDEFTRFVYTVKPVLSRSSLGLNNLFSFRQVFGLHRFKLHRHLGDGLGRFSIYSEIYQAACPFTQDGCSY